MTRLTHYGKRSGKAYAEINGQKIYRKQPYVIEEVNIGPILDKLAAYEDTGYEPEEIASLINAFQPTTRSVELTTTEHINKNGKNIVVFTKSLEG